VGSHGVVHELLLMALESGCLACQMELQAEPQPISGFDWMDDRMECVEGLQQLPGSDCWVALVASVQVIEGFGQQLGLEQFAGMGCWKEFLMECQKYVGGLMEIATLPAWNSVLLEIAPLLVWLPRLLESPPLHVWHPGLPAIVPLPVCHHGGLCQSSCCTHALRELGPMQLKQPLAAL